MGLEMDLVITSATFTPSRSKRFDLFTYWSRHVYLLAKDYLFIGQGLFTCWPRLFTYWSRLDYFVKKQLTL
jgi:hypothetical protein